VASYHLSIHPNVSRGRGESLVRTAAYNGRCRLVDERTGEEWDYGYLGQPLWQGMYAPKDAPEWARDLGRLANAVEAFERRSDAQLAMNLDIALPHEQTLEQNRRLMQDFVRENFVRQGYAAHVSIHAPDPNGDARNIHAHVLVTLRKIGPDGFAPTKSEQQDRYRNRREYTEHLRDAWEKLANRHLERNGIDARIDRRTLKEQGIEREPERHRGPTVTNIERNGRVTNIADKIRGRQNQRAELGIRQAQIIDLAAERARRRNQAAAGDGLHPMIASMDGGMVAQQREANRLLARYKAVMDRRAQGPPLSRHTAASGGQAAAVENSTPAAAAPVGSVGNDPARGHQPLVVSSKDSAISEKSSAASPAQVTESLKHGAGRTEQIAPSEGSALVSQTVPEKKELDPELAQIVSEANQRERDRERER
jgi:hypothetical protein